MKFLCKVDIDLPRSEVIPIFDNPENMKFWQDDFISFEHLTGEPGTSGATSRVKYKRVELIETIIERRLPEAFHGSYEGSWGKNVMYNYFEETGTQSTRWTAEVEYTEMNNFMMKFMGKFFPSMFRKQTQKWMDQFKTFAENRSN